MVTMKIFSGVVIKGQVQVERTVDLVWIYVFWLKQNKQTKKRHFIKLIFIGYSLILWLVVREKRPQGVAHWYHRLHRQSFLAFSDQLQVVPATNWSPKGWGSNTLNHWAAAFDLKVNANTLQSVWLSLCWWTQLVCNASQLVANLRQTVWNVN